MAAAAAANDANSAAADGPSASAASAPNGTGAPNAAGECFTGLTSTASARWPTDAICAATRAATDK